MNEAELGILSIIAESPRNGRDVQHIIDERNLRMWTRIGVESVKYVIEKLEKQGLIEAVKHQRAPNVLQTLYRVTPAGIGVLQTAITSLLTNLQVFPQAFDIGLANLMVLKTPQAHNALLDYRDNLEARHALFSQQLLTLRQQNAPFHILSMFERQVALLRAELVWFEGWIQQWEQQAPAETPPQPHPYLSDAPLPRMQQRIMPHEPDSFHKKTTRPLTPRTNTPIVPPDPGLSATTPPPSNPQATQINRPTPPYIAKTENKDEDRS